MPRGPTVNPLRAQLGRRLRILRAAQGWSQETLAAASGLHRTYISAIERGRCNLSLDNLARLAAAFGVTSSALLDGGERFGLPKVPGLS